MPPPLISTPLSSVAGDEITVDADELFAALDPQEHAVAEVGDGRGAGHVGPDPVARDAIAVAIDHDAMAVVPGDDVALDDGAASPWTVSGYMPSKVLPRAAVPLASVPMKLPDTRLFGLLMKTPSRVPGDDVALQGVAVAAAEIRWTYPVHGVAQGRRAADVGADEVARTRGCRFRHRSGPRLPGSRR